MTEAVFLGSNAINTAINHIRLSLLFTAVETAVYIQSTRGAEHKLYAINNLARDPLVHFIICLCDSLLKFQINLMQIRPSATMAFPVCRNWRKAKKRNV